MKSKIQVCFVLWTVLTSFDSSYSNADTMKASNN